MSCFRRRRNAHVRLDPESGPENEQDGANKVSSRRRLANDYRTVKRTLPYLWPKTPGHMDLKVRVVGSLLCLLVSKILSVSLPLVYKNCVDALTGDNPSGRVYMPTGMILTYGAVRLGSSLFDNLRDALFVKVTQNALRKAALQTFTHLHSLSLAFHLHRKTGGVLRAISRGTRGISTMLSFFLFSIGPIILEVTFSCAVLLYYYKAIFAIITLSTIVLYVVYTLVVTEWRNKFRRTMNEKDNLSNDRAVDSLLNYATVKYFSNEAHERERYDVALQGYMGSAIKSQTSLMVLNVGQAGIIAVGVTAVMLVAAHEVVAGRMTAGDFVMVNVYLLQLYLPLNFLGSAYRMIKQALVDVEQMFDLLNVEQDVVDTPDPEMLVADDAAIEFDNVEFAYREDVPVLRGVSFRVPAGRSVAIVGPTGAGKSTIARLLFRFYDCNGGAIRIGGTDITAVTQQALRQAVGIVPQDTVLFNDTLGYNIRYGRITASDAEVEEAARMAQIHDFVQGLPDGYDTRVGERGLRLSGGEKQRVAIARAILKDAPIMVYDEATSALDTHTEREIQHALDDLSHGRTTVIVAHRLSTVVDCDEILVLMEGRIHERGSHRELLALGGVYESMWRAQQEAANDDGAGSGDAVVATGVGAGDAAAATVPHHHHHHH